MITLFYILLTSFGSISSNRQIFFPEKSSSLPEPECTAYNGRIGSCKLLAKCSTHFAQIAELSRSPCIITEEQQGVCCPPKTPQSRDPSLEVGKRRKQPSQPMVFPEITSNSVDEACSNSVDIQFAKDKFKENLAANNIVAPKESPVFWHARLFETTNEIFKISKDANTVLDATIKLKENFQLNKVQAEEGLAQFEVKDTIISDRCPTDPVCPEPSYTYRTMDGTCNNARHNDWGKTGASFTRMLPADYEDGVKEIRKSTNQLPLPSARLVSSEVTPSRDNSYVNFTILIWQWGQFLDHDVTHTPISKGANKDVDISCCINGQHRPITEQDPECFPIEIPASDKFYSSFKQSCMEFVRSMPAIRPFCKFGPREQMNQITSYIDASQVYGSTVKEMRNLRSGSNGTLKVTHQKDRDLLPPNENDLGCNRGPQKCFLAGDTRVNEQPDLAVMHTVFMRQHNKIVTSLAKINPHWDDEILFQEGRRIVGAQMQHITYNEYLPIVLGTTFMETFGLLPLERGHYTGYREDVDATINNVFATAAFRYGHSLITDELKGFDKFGKTQENMELSKTQFVPFPLYKPHVLDNLIRGLSLQTSQRFDRFFSDQLTNKLFAQNGPFGMDLVALNVQRGRDHGLPSYTKWREVCDLPPVRDWNDIARIMKSDVVDSLRAAYDSVDDIDLFIGATSEHYVEGTLVGSTFLCILGRQFIKLKIGDRFYYENGNERHASLSQFTEGQLAEIRKTTLSRILCDNSDKIELMQPLAFVVAHLANKRAACAVDRIIPKMSLEPWINARIWTK